MMVDGILRIISRIISFHWRKRGLMINFQRENVNRKKLWSIWWNVKNYIFEKVMTKPIKNF